MSRLPRLYAVLAVNEALPLVAYLAMRAAGVDMAGMDAAAAQWVDGRGGLGERLMRVGAGAPGCLEVALDMALFFAGYEVLFYYSHRMLHHPALYARVHKLHHEWKAPIALAANYMHPVEHIVSGIGPSVVVALLLRPHPLSLVSFALAGMLFTLLEHSGFSAILGPGSEFHDVHHRDWLSNFGVIGSLDRWHGTYRVGKRM